MPLPPPYATFLQNPPPPSVEGWTVGRNRNWAMVVPDRDPDPPTGWRLRASVVAEDLEQAWDTLRPVLEQYRLPARVALPETAQTLQDPLVPGAGALIIITADRRTHDHDGGVRWWQDVVDTIEARWTEAGIGRGLPVLSDRPLPGCGYCSVRCDAGLDGDVERHLDYNLASQPSPFWYVSGQTDGIGEITALLEGVVGPVAGDWEEHGAYWRIAGTPYELIPVKQAALQLNLPFKLWRLPNGWQAGWPVGYDEVLIDQWHTWREHTDAWRVALALGRQDVAVRARQTDAIPPAIVLPALSSEEEGSLIAMLARGGLSLLRRGGGPLEIPIPGRALADAFVGQQGSSGEERPQYAIAKELIDPADTADRPLPARVLPPLRPRQPRELAAISRAASAARHRRDPNALRRAEAVDRLRRAGVVKVVERKGLDRLLMQREREVGAPFAEDPKQLLGEMIVMLDAAAKLDNTALSSQQRAFIKGSALGMDRLRQRPDLSMGRAFEAIKKGNRVVESSIRHLREHHSPEGLLMADALSEMSGRVQARMMTGAPTVRLALTPEEIARMRKKTEVRH